MRVLVTGDRGYIGSVLVPVLQEAGHEVVGLDAGWYDGCDFGPLTTTYKQLTGDVRDVTAYHLFGFDAVVHLAAISNDPVGDLDPTATFSVNVDGAVHLADTAKAAGVPRFLFSSSCALYGAAGRRPVAEDAEAHPVTPYGESIVRAESAISALADDTFSPTYLRSGTTYGSSPRLRTDIVLNNLVASALATGSVQLSSDGTPWRPMVHVRDVCAAFVATLEAPRERVHGAALNVGRAEDVVQIGDLAHAVSRRTGAPVRSTPGAGPDPRDYRADFTRITSTLPAFRPRWTIEAGIDELVHDVRRIGISPQELGGPRFVRLQRIRQLLAKGRMSAGLRAEITAV
ncbi:NAD-dependent epimerase/dehydratase family protein [Nocardioides sp. AN3]